MILPLITDMYRDPKLQERLHKHPAEVIKKYQLTPEDLAALKSRDTFRIAARAADEVRQMRFAMARPGHGRFWWGLLSPSITAIDPQQAPATVQIEVTVTGENFYPNATLTFLTPGQPDINASVVSISDDGTTLTALVSLPVAGPYDVQVINTDGQSDTLAQGFTVPQ